MPHAIHKLKHNTIEKKKKIISSQQKELKRKRKSFLVKQCISFNFGNHSLAYCLYNVYTSHSTLKFTTAEKKLRKIIENALVAVNTQNNFFGPVKESLNQSYYFLQKNALKMDDNFIMFDAILLCPWAKAKYFNAHLKSTS